MQITVKENNVEQAIKVLKKKLQKEGLFKEIKERRFFEKPSETRAKEVKEIKKRIKKFRRSYMY
ncbi:MAG: 30S ribosomal protein S21 [Alphaproteobacteria bacterium]|jgi:small subunit ribosomal protein S21